MNRAFDKKTTIFISGAAGFIGASLCLRLIREGHKIIGFDNLNEYYDTNLKRRRIANIEKEFTLKNYDWEFVEGTIESKSDLLNVFKNNNIDFVVNLAAQAGVRYSLQNPEAYINSNILGFANILELCRSFNIKHLIYASSSSVYGGNKSFPFKEKDNVDHPISLYAATKKSNELMAHSYSHLFKIPSTGLRFFTVYGPWGRPDMAPMIFAKAMLEGRPISIFNNGNMKRDFTYIDDIVDGVTRCIFKPATTDKNFDFYSPNGSTSFAPHRIFNIGNNKPISILRFVDLLEESLSVKAIKKYEPIQKGDVEFTFSDTSNIKNWVNYSPKTGIELGVKKFAEWYKSFYRENCN